MYRVSGSGPSPVPQAIVVCLLSTALLEARPPAPQANGGMFRTRKVQVAGLGEIPVSTS